MATLSRDQIAMYARAAGLSGGSVDIAVAVALAESGGNPRAHNPVPPDNSYGLWQINMLGSLGPDRRKKLGITSNSALFDPAVNARAMSLISSKGTNWTPWSTYTNGAYKKHLQGGAVQTDLVPDFLVPDPLEDFADGAVEVAKEVGRIAQAIAKAGNWLSRAENWLRIGYVAGGGVLVAAGLTMVVRKEALKKIAPALGQAAGKKVKAVRATAAAKKTAGKKQGTGDSSGS